MNEGKLQTLSKGVDTILALLIEQIDINDLKVQDLILFDILCHNIGLIHRDMILKLYKILELELKADIIWTTKLLI